MYDPEFTRAIGGLFHLSPSHLRRGLYNVTLLNISLVCVRVRETRLPGGKRTTLHPTISAEFEEADRWTIKLYVAYFKLIIDN